MEPGDLAATEWLTPAAGGRTTRSSQITDGRCDGGPSGGAVGDPRAREAVEGKAGIGRVGEDAIVLTDVTDHLAGAAAVQLVRCTFPYRAMPPVGGDNASVADALFHAAAVLGPEFSIEVLAEMFSLDPLHVLDGMAGALDARLVELGPTSGRFTDSGAHRAAYAGLAPSERARLHGLAGDALIRLSQSGRPVEPADIATHLLAAGPAGAIRATAFLVEAGDRHMKAYAYERAREEYGRAAANLASAGGDDALQATVLVALGEADLACGARGEAGEAFRRAVALARRAGRSDLLARTALGLASGATGIEVALVDRAQLDLLEEALAALPPGETAWRSALTARLSVALSMVATDERREALAEEAVALGRRSASPSVLGAALAARCDAVAGPAHVELRRSLAEEIVELGRSERNPELELTGRRLRLVALAELGDFDGVDAEIRDFSALSDVLGQPAYGWYVPLWRGMRALMEGRIRDCRTHLDAAGALGARAESHNAVLLTTTLRWVLLSECVETEQIDHLGELATLDTEPGAWPVVVLAVTAAQAGRPAEAQTRLDTVAARLARAPRDSEWLPMMAQVGQVVSYLGGHPVAAWTYEALLPFAPLFVVEGIGAAVRGSVHRPLGLLAAALGRHQEAEGHFAAALDAHRALGAPLLVAGTLED